MSELPYSSNDPLTQKLRPAQSFFVNDEGLTDAEVLVPVCGCSFVARCADCKKCRECCPCAPATELRPIASFFVDEELGVALSTSPQHDCQSLDRWGACYCWEPDSD